MVLIKCQHMNISSVVITCQKYKENSVFVPVPIVVSLNVQRYVDLYVDVCYVWLKTNLWIVMLENMMT